MAEELKETIDEINRAFEAFRSANDQRLSEIEQRGAATSETIATVEAVNAALTEIRERQTEIEMRLNRPDMETNGAAGADDPDIELRQQAFVNYCRFGLGEGRIRPEEVRALSAATDSEGGFLVPPGYENEILMDAFNQAEIRGVCQPRPTSRDSVGLSRLSKPKIGWGKTNVAVSPQDIEAGFERLQIYPIRALVLLHNDLLDDADADVWGELSAAFSDAIAEGEDKEFCTGAGTEGPRGIVSDKRVQKNSTMSGVADALTDGSNNGFDALTDCLYSLKKTYRRNAVWAMNSTTEAEIRKIRDATNERYLWQPSVQAGVPPTLLGRPLINPEAMPDIAANAYPVVIGDFRRGYAIRDRKGLTVTRLTERYAEYDYTGFMVKKRLGGSVIMPEAFAAVKIAEA